MALCLYKAMEFDHVCKGPLRCKVPGLCSTQSTSWEKVRPTPEAYTLFLRLSKEGEFRAKGSWICLTRRLGMRSGLSFLKFQNIYIHILRHHRDRRCAHLCFIYTPYAHRLIIMRYNSFSAPVWWLQVAEHVISGAFYLEHYVSIQTL